MRALAVTVIVLGAMLVLEGVFSFERGYFAAAGAFAIIAGAAMLYGRVEEPEEFERDYGPLGTPHPGYERGPDGHVRLSESEGAGWQKPVAPPADVVWPGGLPPKPPVRVELDREA